MTQGRETTNVLCVVGARPNFMKIAPIMAAFRDSSLRALLLHTGQHYDVIMNQQFFDQLGIPTPDIALEVGSGSHAVQTAEIMKRFEPVLDEHQPDAVLVVGDVNSTVACALVAAKKNIAVIHVEAGLRSFDRAMPEEINRILTDQLSDLLFTTERDALANIMREGIDPQRVCFVGNVMIDTLLNSLKQAVPARQTLEVADSGFAAAAMADGYGLLTLHRPANVDDPEVLRLLLAEMTAISAELPLVFPVHPRTAAKIKAFGLDDFWTDSRILQLPPQGYLENLGLMAKARLVLTDSGGIQEETTALGVPCLTLRDNTERPITVTQGTNTIVGRDPERIRAAVRDTLDSGGKTGQRPEFWDGHSGERIVKAIDQWLSARNP